ncbi:EAL domain-containing protein [Rhizobium sp. S-51]|uniref:EAL domain-containing protein n=1 Tax=Rhizobium terricola TaxID=2728849 RepID=A0A7Y0FW26_9HYPH|nr:EAL domain-containing protein [Rhizobium terricola]
MLTRLQNKILEMIATGVPLDETVDLLCRTVEEMDPDVICSVLGLDQQNRLRHLAGPSLPSVYSAAIDGIAIGPGVGSCGTAAFTGEPVTVTDIATHPYWAPYKQLALPLGLAACWSSPILASGKVLGTFAFYFRTPRGPTETEQKIVAACVHLCAIALERDQRVAERRRLAETDALTQLPNRSRFNDMVAMQGESDCPWGIILGDVDNLKLVNDTFGHRAGDDLIRTVASRIAIAAEPGVSFRLGGDEFAIVVVGEDSQDLAGIAARVLEAIKAPCTCAEQVIYPSLTLGGAVAGKNDNPEQVRQNADYALYHAKERARGSFIQFVPGLGTAIVKRFRAIQDVTEALREGRIEAYYQPIVDFATGQVASLEALCRMRTRSGDMLAAAHFHEATKDANIAFELTRRMLNIVAADMRRWVDDGLDFGRVSINLAAADFYRAGLTDRVAACFAEAGVPLKSVTLEVTESVYLDQRDQIVADQIQQLRAAGMSVALDDFGTGFASLTHLLTVPVDIIKIDKCFVQRMISDKAGSVIIKGLIDIARGLGIRVVAEGVETGEQAETLHWLGCTYGQGFLYSRAIDRASMTTLLKERRTLGTPLGSAANAPLSIAG